MSEELDDFLQAVASEGDERDYMKDIIGDSDEIMDKLLEMVSSTGSVEFVNSATLNKTHCLAIDANELIKMMEGIAAKHLEMMK